MLGFSFNLRFLRVIINAYFVRVKLSSARNFSKSPKKPEVMHEPEYTPLAPMPAWLLAFCKDTKAREAVDAGAPIPDGQRNDTLFRYGCRMRRDGFTRAVILAALREMNATQCCPP